MRLLSTRLDWRREEPAVAFRALPVGRRDCLPAGAGALVLLVLSTAGVTARAQVTREEALAALFPGAQIEVQRVFLTEAQQGRAEELAGVEVGSLLIARYVVRRGEAVVGRAYVDTHVVRTKNESLLIALNPDGTVRRVEVTAFLEPPDYRAPEAWYAQYEGRSLTDDLNLERAIRPVAGASLTGRATTAAVRRVLAIDQILEGAP